MLLRFDLEKGEAKFAEIKSQSDPQALSTTSTSDDPLKKQTRSMTAASATVSIQSSNRNDGIEPSKIVDATQGVQTQSSGIIFQKVDVATDHLGDCGSVAYNNHKYYHVAMELGDYNFDDLGDAVAYGVVCDALFILVGSKSKALKKILKKMADTPLIRAIPDSICSFIFGTVLDGIFSGGDGTFALWDIDKNGWVNEPKLAVGGSSLYDPSPEYMRDNRKTNEYLGVHTGAFR